MRPEGDAHWITIAFAEELAPYLIRKGSIAVDGVSLTIADLRDGEFDVMIIPFTWTHTNLLGAPSAEPREPRMRHGREIRRPRGAIRASRLKPAPTT